jgi:hypothetical protein
MRFDNASALTAQYLSDHWVFLSSSTEDLSIESLILKSSAGEPILALTAQDAANYLYDPLQLTQKWPSHSSLSVVFSFLDRFSRSCTT